MKRLPICLVLFFLCLSLSGQKIEKTYLRTDKDLYQPGDTLWFKGYVFNRANLISDESLDLQVFLHNEEGLKQADTSWPIIKGMAPGYLVLPIKEGRYFLTAMSAHMLNMDPELSFKKEIFIRSGSIDVIKLSAETNQSTYRPGDLLSVQLNASLSEKEPAAKERFRYAFLKGDELIKDGSFRTDEAGKYSLEAFKIPQTEAPLRMLITKPATEFTPSVNLSIPIALEKDDIDLRFFPEGGQLIAGQNNRVAFKALHSDGSSSLVKAKILNAQKEVVGTMESQYEGMGSFTFRPEAKAYYVQITEPKGIDTLYRLPVVETSGLTANISYSDKDTLVKIMSTPDLKGESYTLSLWQHGRVMHQLNFKANGIQFFKIPFSTMDIGVARLSITNAEGSIISERLLFLKNRLQLQVDISLNQEEYLPREKVEATIRVTDAAGKPVVGNFTFAAIDDTYAPTLNQDQPGLMAQLLLNSELRGHIPNPDFYFSESPEAAPALDLIMLTHGWRKYELISQKDHSIMTGRLVHKKRKKRALANREISIFNTTNYSEEVVMTDSLGRFQIPSHYFKYKGDSFIVAARAKGKKEKPNMMMDTHTQEAMDQYKTNIGTWADTSFYKDYRIFENANKIVQDRFGNTALLNAIEVVAKQTGSDCEGRDTYHKNKWKKKTRGELNLDDLDPISLFKQVSYKVMGFGYITSWSPTLNKTIRFLPGSLLSMERRRMSLNLTDGPLKFVADMYYAVYINCESLTSGPNASIESVLQSIDLSNVESISILDPIYLGDSPGTIPVGLVELHTIDDVVIYKPSLKKFFTYTTNTAQAASFYQMKYETKEARELPIPDLRTTIHWEHTVLTDQNGEAVISFYNADRDHRIRMTVEGLGEKQRFGFAQKDYRVLMPAGPSTN